MSRMRRSMTFAHRVDRLLQSNTFDVVHAITPCRGADVYEPRGGTVAESVERNLALVRLGALRSVKRQANRLNLKQQHALRLERALLRGAEGPVVVAISDYVVRQLKRHYDVPDARIRKIYNGVDPDPTPADERARHREAIRREFGIAEADCLVLSIAHNFRLKGIRQWMEALRLLVSRGVTKVRSLVIGRGDSARWHELARRMGIMRHLTFVGPSERIREFHHAGDVLVHPTFYDPCSRVVLEAMVAGLPCVTTRWDGASEMIEDGISGFVLDDPRDITAIADRVDRLGSVELRRRMGGAASAVAERVEMVRHAAEMMAVYKEVCEARRAEGRACRAMP